MYNYQTHDHGIKPMKCLSDIGRKYGCNKIKGNIMELPAEHILIYNKR